ncbi:hypothetical protein FRC19_005270 [Serendipita sp. 401]|nr:hypothetical protein FRC19_005270 [Serendipita sp. 401]
MLRSEHQRPVSPPWKVRTRPCPFYSSGRCLFKDSCNFRHVIKSPLTPIDNELTIFRQSNQQDEPYDVLDNGEYFHRGSVDLERTTAITGTHARSHSLSTFGNTASPTETGTVRGSLVHDSLLDEYRDVDVEEDPDQTITGLGLTNLHDSRPPFIKSSSALPFESDTTSEQEIALSATVPSRVSLHASWHETAQDLVDFIPPSANSPGQELIVKSHDQHHSNSISLNKPYASSLLINRSRKNTATGEPPPRANTSTTPQSVSRTTSIDFRAAAQISRNESLSPTIPSVEQPPSLPPETPVDYENEPPSRARLRFLKAYQLVTNELRQRVAHLRRSPITPDAPQTQDAIQPTEVLLKSPRAGIFSSRNTSPDTHKVSPDEVESPSFLDGYLEVNDELAREEDPPGPAQIEARPWMKPLRLSTYGSQGFFPSVQPPDVSSVPLNRGVAKNELSLTRPSSPEKRPSLSISSRQNSQTGRQDIESRATPASRTEPSFAGWSGFGPTSVTVPPPVSSSSSRKSSVHYIHSPSPIPWSPADPGTRAQRPKTQVSSGSISPTRISRVQSAASLEPKRPLSARSYSAFSNQTAPTPPLPTHKPELFFAIASSKPEQVARLLATGQASANETVGPNDMPALAFAINSMAEGSMENRPQQEEIVATLLSYGADPSGLENGAVASQTQAPNPLVKYFLDKAQRSPVSHPSMPNDDDEIEIALKRAKFTVVGQENGIEELARAYSAHSRLAKYLDDEEDDKELPFVALFTGPSGHGKTLLASRVGRLLGIPSYTINMTLLKSQVDIWGAVSCNEREAQMFPTLRHFLMAHDNQKSVVVIDEIEKLVDRSLLQGFLVPWETGRVQDSAVINTARTIWICTSNIGSDEIIGFARRYTLPASSEYAEIARDARSCLRNVLGSSLIARVSTVVAFLPFTMEERIAISSKSLSALQRKMALSRPSTNSSLNNLDWSGVVEKAAEDYLEAEGARSIRRTIIRLADNVIRTI